MSGAVVDWTFMTGVLGDPPFFLGALVGVGEGSEGGDKIYSPMGEWVAHLTLETRAYSAMKQRYDA